MILIYTHKITPRVRYVFKHIFTRILSIEIDFTNRVEDFVAHNGPKLSYTNVPLGGEFFIKTSGLLFEQGVNDVEILVAKWEESPCFFAVGEKSSIPYDIFSASFYLISRYEEYLPHFKDIHERFSAEQSLAFKYDFLEKPIIDVWAYKLLDILKSKFPEYEYSQKKYQFISTIDIDNAYAYKYKSFVRTVGAFLKDIVKFKIFNIFNRILVLLNIKKDPFDTFQQILDLQKEYSITTIFFFLVADYTTYDTNTPPYKNKFRLLIKHMLDYAVVGLHPSYFSMKNISKLKKEKERLERITNMPMEQSRQHYLRFSLPKTYQNLIDVEVKEDYSMGYASHVGFRASTCTPFYFYDLDFEIQTPLKVIPFALMDTTLNYYLKLTPKQSLGKIRDLKNEVQKVNGLFVTLFHNESLSGNGKWRGGWKRVYKSMLKIATQ